MYKLLVIDDEAGIRFCIQQVFESPQVSVLTVITSYSIHYTKLYELDDITAMVQGGKIQAVSPELRLGLQQMQLRVMLPQDVLDTIDMIVMTVRQQDVV